MSDCLVVDASVALKWVLDEPFTREAEALLRDCRESGIRVVAPSLLVFEVGNALYKRAIRGDLTLEAAAELLAQVTFLGPELLDDRADHGRALELAYQFARPAAYDAHYLAVAEREGCECWTADEQLWNSVKQKLTWVRWVGEYRSGRQ